MTGTQQFHTAIRIAGIVPTAISTTDLDRYFSLNCEIHLFARNVKTLHYLRNQFLGSQDGGYNKPIPSQHFEEFNYPVTAQGKRSEEFNSGSAVLCDR